MPPKSKMDLYLLWLHLSLLFRVFALAIVGPGLPERQCPRSAGHNLLALFKLQGIRRRLDRQW